MQGEKTFRKIGTGFSSNQNEIKSRLNKSNTPSHFFKKLHFLLSFTIPSGGLTENGFVCEHSILCHILLLPEGRCHSRPPKAHGILAACPRLHMPPWPLVLELGFRRSLLREGAGPGTLPWITRQALPSAAVHCHLSGRGWAPEQRCSSQHPPGFKRTDREGRRQPALLTGTLLPPVHLGLAPLQQRQPEPTADQLLCQSTAQKLSFSDCKTEERHRPKGVAMVMTPIMPLRRDNFTTLIALLVTAGGYVTSLEIALNFTRLGYLDMAWIIVSS